MCVYMYIHIYIYAGLREVMQEVMQLYASAPHAVPECNTCCE